MSSAQMQTYRPIHDAKLVRHDRQRYQSGDIIIN